MKEIIIFYAAVSITSMFTLPLIFLIISSFYKHKKIDLTVYKIVVVAALFLVSAYVFNEFFNYVVGFKLLELIVVFHLMLAGYAHVKSRQKGRKSRKARKSGG